VKNPDSASPFRVTPQAVVGLLIVLFGLALTAENLGWMHAGDLLRYWPLGIVAVGVAKLLQSRTRSGLVGGGVLAVLGGLLTIEEFFYIEIDVWRWWPLAIVVIGLIIVSKAFDGRAERGRSTGGLADAAIGVHPVREGGKGPAVLDQTISEFAMWAGIQRRVASPSFRHGDLTAIMGGIEVDLRAAGTANGEAIIDVFALWGGIEITVPPDWAVSNKVVPIMGAAEDGSAGTQAARHHLTVRGFAIMGGVEIKT